MCKYSERLPKGIAPTDLNRQVLASDETGAGHHIWRMGSQVAQTPRRDPGCSCFMAKQMENGGGTDFPLRSLWPVVFDFLRCLAERSLTRSGHRGCEVDWRRTTSEVQASLSGRLVSFVLRDFRLLGGIETGHEVRSWLRSKISPCRYLQ